MVPEPSPLLFMLCVTLFKDDFRLGVTSLTTMADVITAFRAACGPPLGEGIGIAPAPGAPAWNETTWQVKKLQGMKKKTVDNVNAVVLLLKSLAGLAPRSLFGSKRSVAEVGTV